MKTSIGGDYLCMAYGKALETVRGLLNAHQHHVGRPPQASVMPMAKAIASRY